MGRKSRAFLYALIMCLLLSSCSGHSVRNATDEEIARFSKYGLEVPQETSESYIAGIVAHCIAAGAPKEIDGSTGGKQVMQEYIPDGLCQIIPMCRNDGAITSIIGTEGRYYIQYNAEDEMSVLIVYDEQGLSEMIVYSENRDVAFINESGNCRIEKGFRRGVV